MVLRWSLMLEICDNEMTEEMKGGRVVPWGRYLGGLEPRGGGPGVGVGDRSNVHSGPVYKQ